MPHILAALLLATFAGVAAAQDTQTTEAEDPVVLRVGEYQETRTELEERFEVAIRGLAASQGLELTEDVRSQLESFKPSYLEQRATEVALLQEAERRGIVVSDEEIDERLADVRASLAEGEDFDAVMEEAGFRDEQQLRKLVSETEHIQRAVDAIEADIAVDEAEVQAFYEQNPELFEQPEQVCARHILLESEEEASETLAEIQGGADFAELAAERSIDPGGQNGGDLGCFGRGQMVPPFEEAAFAAEVDEPTGPVESQFGQHLILVYDRRDAGTVELAEVQDQIEQQLQRERLAEAVDAVRDEADVEMFPENLGVDLDAPLPGEEPEGTEQQ